jgi:hypothetical protein
MPAAVVTGDKTLTIALAQTTAVIAELGVADRLASGPRTAAELAPEVGADADALHRVLRAGVVANVLRLSPDGRFRLTRLGQVLRSDHPRSVRAWVRHSGRKARVHAFADLLETVRTGESAFRRVHGKSVWEHFAAAPQDGEVFNAGMRAVTEMSVPPIVSGYPWPSGAVVCDVAGGVGTLLGGVLRGHPELCGILVDSPAALDEAVDLVGDLHDRIDLRAGDIFAKVPAEADIYLLKDILHDWDDRACSRILRTIRDAAPVGARLLLIEMLQERNRAHPAYSLADLEMMTQTENGRQRSVRELSALAGKAGFGYRTTYHLGLHSVVETFAV